MGKYLKMSDYFNADYKINVPKLITDDELYCGDSFVAEFTGRGQAIAAAHAINSHDDLVAEVERLTKSAELAIMTLEEVDRVLTERVKNGAYDLDDISGEVTYALYKLSARE